jgi:aspartyl-tRNA(Asn)/glutamyl-tRNA(Gln) amidotransferase subunit A
VVELQQSAHQVLGFHLAPECVAGVAKCLNDLTVHIERVRAFAGAASRHEAAGSDGAGAADTVSAGAAVTRAVAPDAVAGEVVAVRTTPPWPPLLEIANAVRTGSRTAESLTLDALDRIARLNPRLRAVTRTLTDRALRRARFVDSQVARGIDPGMLAGVPFGVKDLFDIAGLPNTAGAQMRQAAPCAHEDAAAIRRLEAAGAVLVATLNMDAYAYGFVTDNAFHGITRNPNDIERFAGGSSGGSAAAIAGQILPLTLGSDTNGSIRVPAALCGIYGLKPTHNGLPMDGVFPFVQSLDDIGPFSSSLADLKLSYEVLQGARLDPLSPAALRVGRLDGWFNQNLDPELVTALVAIDRALGGLPVVDLAEAEFARSAAFVLTAMEGGAGHIDSLRRAAMAYDPGVRDRLIAGALLPTPVLREMQAFRTMFTGRSHEVFERFDVLLAPAVACRAPRIDDPYIDIGAARVPARSHLGMLTQPLSFAGLPVLAAPLPVTGLPLGVQLVGAPGSESKLFALAEMLHGQCLLGSHNQEAAT